MLQVVVKAFDVSLYHEVVLPPVQLVGQLAHRIMRPALRSISIAARQKVRLVYCHEDLRHRTLQQLVLQHRDTQGPQLPVAFGYVPPANQPGMVALAFQPLHQVGQVGFQVLFIFLEGHSVHAAGRFLPQKIEAGSQRFLIELPIQVSKPVVPVSSSLVGYGPQEGWPALSGRSYRAGCLCGLRCPVAPFAQFGACALP